MEHDREAPPLRERQVDERRRRRVERREELVLAVRGDAKRAKPGLWEVASGGTLVLDEVTELPLPLQNKLLKVIEDKRVRRLGAVTERVVDVKLMAATQAELSTLVTAGRFRADLYFRLAQYTIDQAGRLSAAS